ncbi:Ribosomal protein S5 domain 2-type fold subgroup domain-containing protein [Dioscorea alata]|uniref:Ribosomal protein S5 domain 2-type fold subgroup domain-containing protein n=1 Tax=Dioscorea alata TaxID=55571 RepID=A0ACB7V711_DIOAL|nr:Ribosomal protein S5 domain 2-type fold subgroup domain-containing protein [Dioscorea alata]
MADQGFHTRSNSLPTRSHPMIATAEEEVNKLKACVMDSPNVICKSLSSLGVFYDCIEGLLHLPSTQQALSHSQEKKWVEEELDASLRLVELCGIIRHMLAATKEHAQELEMVLRRKRSMNTESKHQCHIQTDKKTSKSIKNIVKALMKQIDGKDSDRSTVSKMFTEAREVAISLLQSVASSLSPSSTQKASKWSIVSKALHKKKVTCLDANGIDFLFNSIYECVSCKDVDGLRAVKAQEQLTAMMSSLERVEMELESLYRKLIRNRVSLLNMLSQ